jgi:mRNA-capping enzyme
MNTHLSQFTTQDSTSQQPQRDGDPGPVPDRWLKCPRSGEMLNTFLPFKTPLDDRFETKIPAQYRFTPEMFIAKWSSRKIDIGLIIDLTNTTRFYDKQTFLDHKIEYKKLKCAGHKEAPTVQQCETFIEIVSQFLQYRPQKNVGIGVHCTHGFNRTGFLIVSYLCEKLDWELEMAIQTYANIRSPGIYKQHYITELYARYDPDCEIHEQWRCVDNLPDWCFDDDEADNVGIPEDEMPELDEKQKNFVDDVNVNARFKKDETVVQIFDKVQLGKIQRKVKSLFKTDKNKFIGAQPVSLDRQNITFLSQKNYHISWKADGTRYLMFISDENKVYMLDRDNCVFQIKNIKFPNRKDFGVHIKDSVFDGEMIVDIDPQTKQEYPRFLIYDALIFQGNLVGHCCFETRISCIQKEIIGAREEGKKRGLINRDIEPFGIRWKEFKSLLDPRWKKFMTKEFENSLFHETDGIILQPSGKEDKYTVGRCIEILKWKPPELNSIDFKLVVKKTKAGVGEISSMVGFLYLGGEQQPVGQLPMSSLTKKLDGKIVECKFDQKSKRWIFMRERTDKTFPNHSSTARGVWDSIINPVNHSDLLSYIDKYKFNGKKQQHGGDSKKPMKRPSQGNTQGEPSRKK